jgi:hypothetical protein
MENTKIVDILEKLKKLSFVDQRREIGKCSIEILELIASKIYNGSELYLRKSCFDILDKILLERALKIGSTFEWTDENKQKLLKVNDKFMQVFEDAYNEAVFFANELENRINNNDKFIKDYEVEIRITPYMSDRFYNDDINGNCIGYVLSEPDPHSPINFSFGHYHFQCEKPIYLDKSLNWNREYFGDTFKDNYICYEIHKLLDSHWSLTDIINIDKIWADVEVIHQHYIENI